MTTRPGTDGSAETVPVGPPHASERPTANRPAGPGSYDDVTRGYSHRAAARPSGTRGPGIGTQIFVACATLVVLTLGASIAFATWRANVVAERAIRAALEKVPQLFGVFRTSVEDELVQWLRSAADEPGSRALFAGTDAETRTEWARDVAALHGARTVFLFDRAGALLARSDQPPGVGEGRSFAGVRWVLEPLEMRHPVAAAIREREVLSLVASVPVLAGQGDSAVLSGVLAATVALDATRAREVQALTGGEVGFLADVAKLGEPPEPALSATTDGFQASEFGKALIGSPGRGAGLLSKHGGRFAADLAVAGDSRLVTSVPIESAAGEVLGACVVSRSRAEETAAFRDIRDSLLALGAVALLLALPLSFWVGRGLARPIEQLALGARAVRDGRLDVELPSAAVGEVGALAGAFRDMVGELREKAALEALVAELRQGGDGRDPRPAPAASRGRDADTRMPAVGERFSDRYDVVECLGSGGMGSVFRVRDRELDDDVALKVLLPEAFPGGHMAPETLRQEIRLARKITHPNVVRTHDLGEWSGIRFLTMEFVPGTTLREMIDRLGALALGPGLQIAKQLCRGLVAVHEAGIIHRDVKPQNVMVLPNGVVKLMDFGISRVAEGADLVADGAIVGTPAYMSPEQARGLPVDVRTDVYAVGVVMFEMFTGFKPIRGRTPLETLERAVSETPPAARDLRPDLPPSLDTLIAACVAKRVEDRPASADELYRELKTVAL